MTKPTPVQIEAAANAMIDCMFAPHELPLDGELQGKYYETAKAALTAAAEVGGLETYGNLGVPAAAEVGHADAIEWQAWSMKVEADTIERCAQVAEQWMNRPISANEIARAIRALVEG